MFGTSEEYEGPELAPVMPMKYRYLAGINKEPIEEWLENNKPSSECSDEGLGWMHVFRMTSTVIEVEKDLEGLGKIWQALNKSQKHICPEKVFELARDFRVTCGKWMFWVSYGGKADHLWSLVAKGVASGKTLASQAKISTYEKTGYETDHVVCIYNGNFLDEEQVYESERTIRSLGIKCSLHYKPECTLTWWCTAKIPGKSNPSSTPATSMF